MRRIAQARPLWKLTATAAVLWCFSAAAAEPATTAAKGSQAAKAKTVSVKKSENLDASYSKELNKRYAAQDLKMAEAVKLVDAKNFAKGVELAENIREELKLEAAYTKGEVIAARVAEAEALVERLRLIWGRDRMRAAHDAYTKGNHHDALIYSTEAARISPALNEDAENMRKRCQGRERSEKFQKLSNLNVANPDLRNLRKEAANLMAEAKVFFENKRYPQALDKIEQVYLRDPFNLEAVALAGQIYRVFFTTGYYRHRADFELQNAYTTWQWIEPVFEAPEAPKEITSQENKDSHKIMSDKLSNTILPEFSYTKGNGNARGAVELLKSYLERNKMDIKIQHSITAAEAASLGAVRLDLRNVSVADVLRYISLMSGLKYRVDSHGVHIGTSVETMYSRSYEIQPHVIAWVFTSTSGDSASNSSSSEEDTSVSAIFRKKGAESSADSNNKRMARGEEMKEELKLTELSNIKVDAPMFKEYLIKHGIRFGEESSISYFEGTLVVKNTIENLDAISQLLREQNALQAPLILVEVKCIEIGETDMEELGFDWSLGDSNLNSNMNNDGGLVNTNKGGWMVGPGKDLRKNDRGERGSMNPIRTGFGDGSSSVPLINNLNIFPMLFGSQAPFGSDVPINISLTVNALSQNTRTEVVSAPKVVALSGITATAKMTKSYYFPDDWSELDVETDTGDDETSYEIKRPNPEFGDEEEIGIDMKVTPTMTETGTINLKLDFEVLGTNGVDEFTFVLNGNVNGRPINHSFTVWKPVITERKVVADIDVYDGQTVVIGGSTDNRTVTRHDKIPFLGELPLIGRLFQAQSEKAERRNMLLFVTARKLDTDGSIVNSRNQGMPDFSR